MTAPTCPAHHVPMEPRAPGTPEQAWCGDWHVCPTSRCLNAHLTPSPALAAQSKP